MRLAALPLTVLLWGCATPALDYGRLDVHLKGGRCQEAAAYLEESRPGYGENMALNYLLDSAMVHMRCGQYEASNRYLQKADLLAEELWTESLSRQAVSLLTNEYALPYQGEDFERALINLLSALNYVMLGNFDEALVECRRLDSLLNLYNSKYEKKNVYKEDAFGRYLSGLIYDSRGELDDAFIDYRKAFEIYKAYEGDYKTPMPDMLPEDLARTAAALGRFEEVKNDLAAYPGISARPTKPGKGRIVLVRLNGRSPEKVEEKIAIATRSGPVSMAFPRFETAPPACRGGGLVLETSSGREEARERLVEDINAIAVKNLDDRKGRVIAKTLLRVAAKRAAVSEIDNQWVKLAANIADTAFLERADTRSWRTLPGEIHLSRALADEGRYRISASRCGRVTDLGEIDLLAGETRFFVLHDID